MVKGRTVDKWKTKSWYTVYAPEIFEGKEIGKVPATEDKILLNRIIRIGLADITGDFSQTNITVRFRIDTVKGKAAQTKLIGHELSRGYLKTLVRRGRSVLNVVQDVLTKDEIPLRIKTAIFTARRTSTPAAKEIRRQVRDEVAARTKSATFQQLEQEIIFGKFSSKVFSKVKKIAPMRRVEIRKTEVRTKK